MKEKLSDFYYPVVTTITLFISLFTLSRNAPRVLGFDYLGLLVGILGLLVAILLSWQFINYIQYSIPEECG